MTAGCPGASAGYQGWWHQEDLKNWTFLITGSPIISLVGARSGHRGGVLVVTTERELTGGGLDGCGCRGLVGEERCTHGGLVDKVEWTGDRCSAGVKIGMERQQEELTGMGCGGLYWDRELWDSLDIRGDLNSESKEQAFCKMLNLFCSWISQQRGAREECLPLLPPATKRDWGLWWDGVKPTVSLQRTDLNLLNLRLNSLLTLLPERSHCIFEMLQIKPMSQSQPFILDQY